MTKWTIAWTGAARSIGPSAVTNLPPMDADRRTISFPTAC